MRTRLTALHVSIVVTLASSGAWAQLDTTAGLRPSDHVYALESRPCATIVDFDRDGAIDVRITYTYDGLGQLIREEEDHHDDGTVDSFTVYDRDADGRLLSFERDVNADGSPDEIHRYTYIGDVLVGEQIDSDGDGITELHYTFVYDEQGRWLQEIRQDGSMSTVFEASTFTHDLMGRIRWESVDVWADGHLDFIIGYTYTDGQLHAVDDDWNADGVVDHRSVYLYGANNAIVIEEWESGVLDTALSRTIFVYDSAGRLTSQTFDDQVDGAVDLFIYHQYECEP